MNARHAMVPLHARVETPVAPSRDPRPRQFALSTSASPVVEHWRCTELGGPHFLHHHPELPLELFESDRSFFLILGLYFDYAEHLGMPPIAEAATRFADLSEAIDRVRYLAGRWVVICRYRGETFVFTDAGGLFGVFYASAPGVAVRVSCNPEVIAECERYGISESAAQFFARPAYRSCLPIEVPDDPSLQDDNWWPGTMTPYHEVKRLLPNHFLDLNHVKTVRYWPAARIAARSVEDAAGKGADFMRQVVCGLARKRPIALPVTAGLDTRLLLAASREVSDRVDYFCYSPDPDQFGASDADDANAAASLAQSLGLDIKIFHYDKTVDRDFAEMFLKNASFHTAAMAILQVSAAFVDHGLQNRLVLNGNVSEICRNYYGVLPKITSAKVWAHLIGMGDSRLATKEVAAWLQDVRPNWQPGDMELSDLFYWEFRIGGWQSLLQLQMNPFVQMFTPYNCRHLLETMLGVELRYRAGPDYPLYKKMIQYLWPECLSVPINPAGDRRWRRKVRLGVAQHRYMNLLARSIDRASRKGGARGGYAASNRS